jgi:AcrR family transcriptional regulator
MRNYELKERARKQADTRRRIVEATVALHEEVGPARTTVAEIARRAGVQRLTVYNHFPDEHSLFGACSGHWIAGHPPPDPGAWAAIADPRERLRAALGDLAAWHRGGEAMLSQVRRDVQLLPALNDVVEAGQAPFRAVIRDVLGAGWGVRGKARDRVLAALGWATDFRSWQQLVREQGLSDDEAVEVLAGAVEAAVA